MRPLSVTDASLGLYSPCADADDEIDVADGPRVLFAALQMEAVATAQCAVIVPPQIWGWPGQLQSQRAVCADWPSCC